MNMGYEKQISCVELEDYGKYATKIQFSINVENELNVEMITAYTDEKYGRDIRTIGFVSADLYKELGNESIAALEKMKFTTESIIGMLSCVCTETDKDFALSLLSSETTEDYQEVFKKNPKKLSVSGQNILMAYTYGIYDHSIEVDESGTIYNQNFEQLTKLLNGILYKQADIESEICTNRWAADSAVIYTVNSNYTMDYLVMLSACIEDSMIINGNLIYNSYEDVPAELINTQNKLLTLNGLIASMGQMEIEYKKDFDWNKLTDPFGEHGFSISELGIKDNCNHTNPSILGVHQFSYKAGNSHFLGEEDDMAVYMSSLSPQSTDDIEELAEYQQAVRDARQAEIMMPINVAISTISIFYPQAGLAYSLAKWAVDEGSIADTASNMSSVAKKYSNETSIELKSFSILTKEYNTLMKAYERRDEAYAEILDDWFEGSIYMETDSDYSAVVSKGCYAPEEIIKKSLLYHEGFSFLCADEESVEAGTQGIDEFVNTTEKSYIEILDKESNRTMEEKVKILHILWTGPKSEEDIAMLDTISDDDFQDYVYKLNEIMKDDDVKFIDTNSEGLEYMYKNYGGNRVEE